MRTSQGKVKFLLVRSVLSQCWLASEMRRCGVEFESLHLWFTQVGVYDRGHWFDPHLRCCKQEHHLADS